MKCPKCANEEVQIVEGVKGKINIWWKILAGVLGAYLFIGGIAMLKENSVLFAIGFVYVIVVPIVLKIIEYQRTRKTTTKAVCKNCGNVWFLEK